MNISKDTVVTLSLRITDAKGSVLQDGKHPSAYLHGGYGNVLDVIEQALEGHTKGHQAHIHLSPTTEGGFGQRDESLVTQMPKTQFPPGIKVGGQLQTTPDNGKPGVYTVTKIKGPVVLLDGNHPLAGETLDIVANVLDVRAATGEEIAHGHAHGSHGHHH